MTDSIEFSTGRNYGQPQVITAKVIARSSDEFGDVLTVAFEDRVRGIRGTISNLLYLTKEQVMAAYDSGRYKNS